VVSLTHNQAKNEIHLTGNLYLIQFSPIPIGTLFIYVLTLSKGQLQNTNEQIKERKQIYYTNKRENNLDNNENSTSEITPIIMRCQKICFSQIQLIINKVPLYSMTERNRFVFKYTRVHTNNISSRSALSIRGKRTRRLSCELDQIMLLHVVLCTVATHDK
jgi:hypothetical protein